MLRIMLKVEIITPRKIEFTGEADVLVLPTQMGEISVLANHEPLVSVLKPGRILVKRKDKEILVEIEGGVAEIIKDKAVILLKKF